MLVAVAGAAAAERAADAGPGEAVVELAAGLLIGVAAGGAGGFLVNAARRRGWAEGSFAGSAVLALAVCAYACALALTGNGFIAAFAAGPGQTKNEDIVPPARPMADTRLRPPIG